MSDRSEVVLRVPRVVMTLAGIAALCAGLIGVVKTVIVLVWAVGWLDRHAFIVLMVCAFTWPWLMNFGMRVARNQKAGQ